MVTDKEVKEIKELVIVGSVVFFVISLALKNFGASLRLFLTYMLFIYLPFVLPVIKLNEGIIEKFLFINLLGLSYAAIYVILDVIFKIPLTKVLFVIVTLVFYVFGYVYFRKTSG